MTTPSQNYADYSGDPRTSARDEVRFLIQDTASPFFLADAEIDYLLGKWMPAFNSTLYVAAQAANALATGFAGAVAISADGVSVDTAGLAASYRALADALTAQYAEYAANAPGAGDSWGEVLFDDHFHPRVFEMGNADIDGVPQGGFTSPERRWERQFSEPWGEW